MGLYSISNIMCLMVLFIEPKIISSISLTESPLPGGHVDSKFNPIDLQNHFKPKELIIDELLSKTTQKAREFQRTEHLQPFLSQFMETLKTHQDLHIKPSSSPEHTAEKRPKRADKSPIKPRNVPIARSIVLPPKDDIQLTRHTFLGPSVGICDVLLRTPLILESPPLFILILMVRTALAVIDGVLNVVTSGDAAAIPEDSIRTVRHSFDRLFNSSSSSG